MPVPRFHHIFLFLTLLVTAFIVFFLLSSIHPQQPFYDFSKLNPTYDSEKPCVDVRGYVLGAVRTNATVYLYQTPTFEFDFVLRMVRTAVPLQVCTVNVSKEFKFPCLTQGHYVLAIPSVAYLNRSVGSPLPYKRVTENLSVEIVYQGGNYDYLVTVFSINRIYHGQP